MPPVYFGLRTLEAILSVYGHKHTTHPRCTCGAVQVSRALLDPKLLTTTAFVELSSESDRSAELVLLSVSHTRTHRPAVRGPVYTYIDLQKPVVRAVRNKGS